MLARYRGPLAYSPEGTLVINTLAVDSNFAHGAWTDWRTGSQARVYYGRVAGELTDAHVATLSEAETLAAVREVQKHYRVDSRRLYLMGNSAGGIGTLYLAAKYPQIWAAIAPAGRVIAAWSYPYWRLRDAHVPVLFVHGELDEHANAKWSRAMADAARADNVEATLLVMPQGTHAAAWMQALPQTFDFFDRHSR